MNKSGFDKIKILRNDLTNIFYEIDSKINALSLIYSDMVKTHVDKNYTLGLLNGDLETSYNRTKGFKFTSTRSSIHKI